MCPPCLPGEVWTLVFRLLALSDRLRVRATCKYFRDLVDNALWRDWTVELRRSGDEYEEDYWHMLRRWRVTSARLFFTNSWTHISKELPRLTTLIITNEYLIDMQMQDLKGFTNLKRVHLTLPRNVCLEELSRFLPQRLTHLSVRMLDYKTNPLPAEIPPDSLFKNLKSFTFHCKFDPHPVNALHFFLSSLPQLQHLSLWLYTRTSYEGHISDLPPLHNCSLSSLELVECETNNFPIDFMKMLSPLPFLQSLAILCDCSDDDDESLKLSAWLRDLPALTSLVVECSDVGGFVESIPSSVTRLILRPYYIDSEDMTALSVQLPNLPHLHLDVLMATEPEMYPDDTEMEPYDPEMEPHDPGPLLVMELIPQLFPRLKTLRLFHKRVSEDVFLSLASLKELEVLETLDWEPLPAALVSELRALTNNRVQIYKRSQKSWQRYSYCSSSVPTDYWA